MACVYILLSVLAGAPHIAASQGNFAAGRGSVENLATPPSTKGCGKPEPDARPETVLSTPARSVWQDAQTPQSLPLGDTQAPQSLPLGDTYVDSEEERVPEPSAPPMNGSGVKGDTKEGTSKAEVKDATFWKNHGGNMKYSILHAYMSTSFACSSIHVRPVFL